MLQNSRNPRGVQHWILIKMRNLRTRWQIQAHDGDLNGDLRATPLAMHHHMYIVRLSSSLLRNEVQYVTCTTSLAHHETHSLVALLSPFMDLKLMPSLMILCNVPKQTRTLKLMPLIVLTWTSSLALRHLYNITCTISSRVHVVAYQRHTFHTGFWVVWESLVWYWPPCTLRCSPQLVLTT